MELGRSLYVDGLRVIINKGEYSKASGAKSRP